MSSVVDKDYLQRQIRQVAELLARLVSLALGKKFEAAEVALAEGAQSLLGLEYSTLRAFDSSSATALLGSADRAEVFASLLDAEAELRERQEDPERAAELRRHALEVRIEALLRWPSERARIRATVGLAQIDVLRLAPKYAEAVERLRS